MRSNRAGIRLAAESTAGLVRKYNEDCFVCSVPPESRSALAVIADGIGGHINGGTASLICCRDLARAFESRSRNFPETAEEAEIFLTETVLAVNEKLFRRNRSEQLDRPMGSTVIAVIFTPDELYTAHAGDSRACELSASGEFRQLTCDHTCRAEYLRTHGGPPPDERKIAPNVISRAVGPRHDLEVEFHRFSRAADSRYLLCSDGITCELSDGQLAGFLTRADTPRQAVNAIMRAALLAGGRDNATAVVGFPAEDAMEKS